MKRMHTQIEKLSTMLIFSLDGNIGSGKTTLLHKIATEFPDQEIIDEPVGSWMSIKGDDDKSLLDHFYADKVRWGYSFQTLAFITRFINLRQKIREALASPDVGRKIFITERSVITDRNVFAKMLHAEGKINELEWKMQNMWQDALMEELKIRIAGIIYVNTPPDVCSERIKQRNREGEENITIEYLTQLHDTHQEWIGNTRLPVISIESEVQELPRVSEWIEHIQQTPNDDISMDHIHYVSGYGC